MDPHRRAGLPMLVGLVSLDHRGARFGLGRTTSAYAVWSLDRGGEPVRTFPLTEAAWPQAWRAFQELEGAPAPGGAETRGPAAPPLADVAVLDHRGTGYALGRTEEDYGIWDLRAGGAPVETWPIHPQAWPDAWARFQELEASQAPGPAAAGPPADPGPGEGPAPLVGAMAIDYTGGGFGLGRTADAYAIWDLRAGGTPIRTFPLHPAAWPEAWAAFQALRS